MVCMATTRTVMSLVGQLRKAGCTVNANWSTGLVTVLNEEVTVYQALQKGRGGPWIVRTLDGPNVKWS